MSILDKLTIRNHFTDKSNCKKHQLIQACKRSDYDSVKKILSEVKGKDLEKFLDTQDKDGNTIFDYVKKEKHMVDFLLSKRYSIELGKLNSFNHPSMAA